MPVSYPWDKNRFAPGSQGQNKVHFLNVLTGSRLTDDFFISILLNAKVGHVELSLLNWIYATNEAYML